MDQLRGIKGYPFYLIHEDGMVFSLYRRLLKKDGKFRVQRARILIPVIRNKNRNYLVVTLCNGEKAKAIKTIHRLVAEAFIPNPENKPEVNHIDGDPKNNKKSNLEWATSKENTDHAIKIGIMSEPKRGKNGRFKRD